MQLTLKSGTTKTETVEIDADASVQTLRQEVANTFKSEPQFIVLIHAGKIIKDEQKLAALKITDGHAIHVVLKKGATQPAAAVSQARNPNFREGYPSENQPSEFNPPPNPITDSQFGQSGNNFEEMQQQMMQNPEMMSRLLENPMVSSLMSDPAVINEIMTTNPQMRRLMEQNPDLGRVLRDPENLRQAMDMFRNPEQMQQMMRNQDSALRNIESIPGGFNALTRMHNEIIEPMREATQGESPYAANGNNESNNGNTGGNNSGNSAEPDTSTAPNPWANQPQAPAGGTGTRPQGIPQMTPGLQEAMRNHLQNNPAIMQGMLRERLGAGATPDAVNAATRMMTDPSIIESMAKPEVRAAMQKIQDGFAVINQQAPDLARAMGVPDISNIPGGLSSINLGALGGSMSSAGGQGSGASLGGARAHTTQAQLEEQWKNELKQLSDMGFGDKEKNIRALQATSGDVQRAVNWLVENI